MPEEADPSVRERFDNVVDVARRGADETGSESVDPVVAEHAVDDTLLWFPPGRYRVENLRLEGLSNFGMIGKGATLVVGQSELNAFLIARRVEDLLVDGLTVDCTADNAAAWADIRCVGGENVVRDYTVRGFGDIDERTNGFTLMVEGAETSLDIVRADLSDGAKNGAGTFVFPRKNFVDPDRSPGTLTFKDCVMEGWGKEGLYASPHSGPLRVLGGEYANNAIDQIRVGGGNAPEETVIRGARVRIDHVPPYMPERNRVFRGIWLEEGDLATVADCDLVLGSLSNGAIQAGIIVNEQFGRAEIRDCRIETSADAPAIRIERPLERLDRDDIRTPSLDRLPPEWSVACRRVHIEGTGPYTEGIELQGRDGCRFEDVSIVQRGENADGIHVLDADGCVVSGGSVVARRFPAVIHGSEPTVGRCRFTLEDVTRFEGVHVQGDDQRLVESYEQLANVAPAALRLVSVYCLDDGTVLELLQDDSALALTNVEDEALYGQAVPVDVLDPD